MNQEAEILLQNGFPNHGGDGDLLVGIISKGQIEKDAIMIINSREIKMSKIHIKYDPDWDVTRVQFEVDKNINPPILWWKLYKSKIKVKNTN